MKLLLSWDDDYSSDIDIGLITTAAAGLSECKLLFLNLFPREGIFYWTIKLQQKDAVCHVLMDTIFELWLWLNPIVLKILVFVYV